MSACQGRSAKHQARYRYVCKTTFRNPYEETARKNLWKNNFICHVIRYRLIIFALSVFFGYPLLAWLVRCWSFLITATMVLMLVAVTTVHGAPPRGSNSADSRPSTKALCHHRIIESPNVSFPNPYFNNMVVSLGIFFKCIQNLITQRCSPDPSIFSEYSVTHCRVIHKCSASYACFFLLSSHWLLYTSAPTF